MKVIEVLYITAKQINQSLHQLMNTQNVVYPYKVIVFNSKKKQNTNICYNTGDLKNIMLTERSHFKKIIYKSTSKYRNK